MDSSMLHLTNSIQLVSKTSNNPIHMLETTCNEIELWQNQISIINLMIYNSKTKDEKDRNKNILELCKSFLI
jgi:hypothetical protein